MNDFQAIAYDKNGKKYYVCSRVNECGTGLRCNILFECGASLLCKECIKNGVFEEFCDKKYFFWYCDKMKSDRAKKVALKIYENRKKIEEEILKKQLEPKQMSFFDFFKLGV